MKDIGELKLLNVSMPANQQDSGEVCRPAEGYERHYQYLWAYHNHGSALVLYWTYKDANHQITVMSASKASGEILSFYPYGLANPGFPWKATNDVYPYCTCAVSGGSILTIQGVYIERPLNFELYLEELYGAGKYQLPIQSRE